MRFPSTHRTKVRYKSTADPPPPNGLFGLHLCATTSHFTPHIHTREGYCVHRARSRWERAGVTVRMGARSLILRTYWCCCLCARQVPTVHVYFLIPQGPRPADNAARCWGERKTKTRSDREMVIFISTRCSAHTRNQCQCKCTSV